MSSWNRAPWQNPKVMMTLLLVFVAGAASGAFAMRMRARLARVSAANPGSMKPVGKDAFLERFKIERLEKELSLRPDQVEQVKAVLDDYSKYYQSLQDQLDDMRSTGKVRLMQTLDQAQRAQFEKMLAETR
jgi:hypothetical protein